MSTKKNNKPTIEKPGSNANAVTYVASDDNEGTAAIAEGITQEAIKPPKEQVKLTEKDLIANTEADAKARGKQFRVCPITGVLVTY